jgi:hypothetical protein
MTGTPRSPVGRRFVERISRAFAIAVVALFTLFAGGMLNVAGAQHGGRAKVPRGEARGAQQEQRQALQRQVRQAFSRAVRRRLNLNDDQMNKLQDVNRKYDVQRRDLLRTEREARQGLAATMQDSTLPDATRQARASQFMDQLVQSQRRRADLLESEQKELAGFLTPVQRGQFSAMRERFNLQVQQLEHDSTAAGLGRRGGPPPAPDPER